MVKFHDSGARLNIVSGFFAALLFLQKWYMRECEERDKALDSLFGVTAWCNAQEIGEQGAGAICRLARVVSSTWG
jgi:hypothetical protein